MEFASCAMLPLQTCSLLGAAGPEPQMRTRSESWSSAAWRCARRHVVLHAGRFVSCSVAPHPPQKKKEKAQYKPAKYWEKNKELGTVRQKQTKPSKAEAQDPVLLGSLCVLKFVFSGLS